LLNSGSSSQKRTPLCARLISPGIGLEPPPTHATTQIYDFGEGLLNAIRPNTILLICYILVVDIHLIT
jgi:hypothetical protein